MLHRKVFILTAISLSLALSVAHAQNPSTSKTTTSKPTTNKSVQKATAKKSTARKSKSDQVRTAKADCAPKPEVVTCTMPTTP